MYAILKDFGLPAYLVGIAILLSFAYKRIKEYQVRNLNTTKEQLEAIVELLSDKEKMENKFLVEQVFNYKFNEYIPYSVITILLGFDSPTEAIKNWMLGNRHLVTEFNPTRFVYRGRMASEAYRKIWRRAVVVGYFFFSVAGLFLLLYLSKIFVAVHYAWIIGSGFLVLYLLWVAYGFIDSALREKAAETIMNESSGGEKHNNALNKDVGADAPTPVHG